MPHPQHSEVQIPIPFKILIEAIGLSTNDLVHGVS
jgi:hypothetical protein